MFSYLDTGNFIVVGNKFNYHFDYFCLVGLSAISSATCVFACLVIQVWHNQRKVVIIRNKTRFLLIGVANPAFLRLNK